jgi:hypothetical protein
MTPLLSDLHSGLRLQQSSRRGAGASADALGALVHGRTLVEGDAENPATFDHLQGPAAHNLVVGVAVAKGLSALLLADAGGESADGVARQVPTGATRGNQNLVAAVNDGPVAVQIPSSAGAVVAVDGLTEASCPPAAEVGGAAHQKQPQGKNAHPSSVAPLSRGAQLNGGAA